MNVEKYNFLQREIIELSATVATGGTDTRTSARIQYPFTLEELEIHSTASLQTNFTLRIGISKSGTEAIASDPTFRDIPSQKSSKENQRYPDTPIRLRPQLNITQPQYRLKAEAINNSGATHDYLIIAIIQERRPTNGS